VPCTIVCVGYPLRRTLREALARLGLVRPKLWQCGLGVLLVPVIVAAMHGVDHLIETIWGYMNWPRTNESAFDELMEFARNPAGAVVIGVTAGLGEELVVRGMLQPRLGIVLSNLFFTSLHALQYNWDGLASVFLIGLALGLVRKYTNTTTSAIVHGGYDFVLVMLDVIEQALAGPGT
jgi:membrane protease YdiL (CAAX protease family)